MAKLPTARVYTIPPDQPFALTLAKTLLDEYQDDFVGLSTLQILLPNRRSCRTLAEAFLIARNGKSCLIPRLSPIGDVNEDELALQDIFDVGDTDTPAAIAPLERQMILGQLIHRQRLTLPPAQIFALASSLATLIDDVHTENLDWQNLTELVPADLAHHWQKTVDFLSILFENWPAILAERGLIDPADRRNRLLRRYATQLQQDKNTGRIIAAGSTGSITATRDLLRTIAYLPHGQVILSGLDKHMPETDWVELPETHAQFYLRNLIDHIGISRPDVRIWQSGKTQKPAPRTIFLQQAIAAQPPRDIKKQLSKNTLRGMEQVTAQQPQHEAKIIALKIRETLEDPDKNILVVTPDRTLAQRITAELARWDIRVDDAAGTPLSQTRPGLWLQVTACLFKPDAQAVALLAMLHHPLAGLRYAPADYARHVKWFERYILRGPRWQGSLRDLVSITQQRLIDVADVHHAPLTDFATRITAALQPLQMNVQHSLSEWLDRHLQLAEYLAATDTAEGAVRVWQGDTGEQLANALQDLRQHAHLHPPPMSADDYIDVLTRYLRRHVYRPRFPLHPRIHILGPIEARLQQADLVILAGLNETVWPQETPHDPFMSQAMRDSFGLSPFARRVGQAALDFYLLSHSNNVFITNSQLRDGMQVAPARWLQQMTVVLHKHDLQMPNGRNWANLADQMDTPQTITPGDRPSFAPPLNVRPRQASVSDLELWRRDPYGFYAKKILRLRALEEPEYDAAARDWGNVVHGLLEEFTRDPQFDMVRWHKRVQQTLDGLALPVDLYTQWQQRLRDIGLWLNSNTLISGHGYSEITGKYQFANLDFTVTGRADLLDRENDAVTISDYKTGGATRSKNELLSGYAPQLPFLGLMAQQGGFAAFPPTQVHALRYITLSGKASDPVTLRDYDSDLDTILSRNQNHYARLIAQFDKPDTPYITQPHPNYVARYNDYDHLERVQEWSHAEGGDAS